MIIRTSFYYVKDKMIAEDIAQEVFIKAFTKMEEFRGSSSLETWLYRITVNHCKDYIRSWSYRKLQVTHLFDHNQAGGDLPEEVAIHRARGKALFAKVMELPVKYREVILLYFFEERKTKEIAELLGDKESTVRVRIARALQRLRISIDEEGLLWNT
jgi:RNA polymerase sigma-70 factor, ECF subfamily